MIVEFLPIHAFLKPTWLNLLMKWGQSLADFMLLPLMEEQFHP